MKLPETIPSGCSVKILGDILECSIIDIFHLPEGSRLHARWDTVIGNEKRTIRETFTSSIEKGTAYQQMVYFRPIVISAFEAEDHMAQEGGK